MREDETFTNVFSHLAVDPRWWWGSVEKHMLGIQKNEFEHATASRLYAAVDVCDDSNTPLLRLAEMKSSEQLFFGQR